MYIIYPILILISRMGYMKECFKCKIEKELIEFYKHKQMKDGYLNKCKICTMNDSNENRKANVEYYKLYDRARANLAHRVKARKEYAKTEAYKISCKKRNKKWIENNKEKRAAHVILNNRLRDGKIKKENCKLCGSNKSQAHHKDYSRPLDVQWYCASCHKFKHKVIELKKIN